MVNQLHRRHNVFLGDGKIVLRPEPDNKHIVERLAIGNVFQHGSAAFGWL